MPTSAPTPAPRFFRTPAEFRRWLEKNHATAKELWIGYYKKDSGRGGMVYREALDEALCFGWIDGVVKTIDATSYLQRFSPRRPGSIWSNVNVRHIERLKTAGKMHAAGLAAFETRDPKKTGIYSFENRPKEFPPALKKQFQRNEKAWNFWTALPPGYRRTLTWWVLSAKRPETQQKRLAKLIAESAAGRRIL